MNQPTLDFALEPAAAHADTLDRTGFDIGWDHARRGLVPPPELLLEGTPLGQGWRAGRAIFGRRTVPTQRATRQWLALRVLAWRCGCAFDTEQVTPRYLAQIGVARCPVQRRPLGGGAGQPEAAVIERLNPDAAFVAGNLLMLSHRVSAASRGLDLRQALRRADSVERGEPCRHGLTAAAWRRLATLRSFATPLPFHDAARLPLAVLPPSGARLLNAAQGLQAMLTLQFARPGWAARTRAIADLLPAQAERHDFHLFVGALAPRVLEADSGPQPLTQALEDAWLQERVLRRWQTFVFSLGEAAAGSLLDRCAERGLAGMRTVTGGAEQVVEGRSLSEGGRPPRIVAAATAASWLARRPGAAAQAGC